MRRRLETNQATNQPTKRFSFESRLSAYCGGLWVASLVVMCKMARLLENEARYRYYRDILDRGSAAFDKLLWNGEPNGARPAPPPPLRG